MTESANFAPGEKLPTLCITDRNVASWKRWALPLATGMAIAFIVLYLI